MAPAAAARGESYHAKEAPAPLRDGPTGASLLVLLAGVSSAVTAAGSGLQWGPPPSMLRAASPTDIAGDGEGGAVAGRLLAGLIHSRAPPALLAQLARRLQSGSGSSSIAPATPHQALAPPARMASVAAARGESYQTPALVQVDSTVATLPLLLAGASAAIANGEEGALHSRGACNGEGGGRVLARLLHSGAPQSLLARLAELSWRLKSGSLVAGTASATITDLMQSSSKMAGVHTLGIQHGAMAVCNFETSAKQGQVHTEAGRVGAEQARAHTWQSKGGVYGMPLHSLGHRLSILVVPAASGGARRGYCTGGGNHDEVTKELVCLDKRVTILEKFRANIRFRLFVLGGFLLTTGTVAVIHREEIYNRCGFELQNFARTFARDFARDFASSQLEELYNSFKLDISWPNISEKVNYLTRGYLGKTKEERIIDELKRKEQEALAEKKKKEAQDLLNQRKEEEKRRKEDYERLERERYEVFRKTRPKNEMWFMTYQAWRRAESNRFLAMRDDYLHELFTGRKQWNDEAWIAEKERLLRYHQTDSTRKRLRENNKKMAEKSSEEEVLPWIGYAVHYIFGGYRWK
ncbi:uncharacterized protein LOC119321549 [Triticum dicoccoides]|uniref:uncharacterized protein LOC119321549 n=1 Tax=Triticum dicoccoides TaxID=85692 RepID=UPI0018916DAC|nr:uncharacterized protein LOC119321549 [Triticum dicoccoides]